MVISCQLIPGQAVTSGSYGCVRWHFSFSLLRLALRAAVGVDGVDRGLVSRC